MSEDPSSLVDPQKDAILEHHGDLTTTESVEGDNAFALTPALLEEGAVVPHGPVITPVAGDSDAPHVVHGEIIGTAVNEETGETIPQYDISLYRWQQNGRKLSKITEKNETLRRQHWRCSNWDKPSKEKGCKAKYRIDIYENGKPASEPYKNDTPHNHLPPPERGRVDMETQLQLAVQPVKRERKRKSIEPAREQRIEDPEAKRRRDAAQAKEAFDRKVVAIQSVIRLFDSYGDNFTRRVDLYPEIRAIFASPKGVEELIKHNDNVFMSSDYIALGLTLIIFSVVLNGEENAVLWLIANGNDTNNYEQMLRYVHDEVATGRFKPINMVWKEQFKPEVDGPFREAFVRVFPMCNILMGHPAENDPPLHVPNPTAAATATMSTPTPQTTLASAAQAVVNASAALGGLRYPQVLPDQMVAPHSMIATTILSSLERPQ